MGLSLKVMPGVRIRVSKRGLRTSVGPRIARVHVGGGRAGISSGVGPVGTYSSLGSSHRNHSHRSQPLRRSSPGSASIATQQRAMAQATRQAERDAREEQIRQLSHALVALISIHEQDFPPATRPIAPPPPAPNEAAIRQYFLDHELSQVGTLDFGGKRTAKERADALAQQAIAAEYQRINEAHRTYQAELDRWWTALVNNDPGTVIQAIEDAFADNAVPAFPIDCEGDRLTVVVVAQPASFLPDKKPALTDGGKPTLRPWSKTDRNDVYCTYLQSATAATVNEAKAVAPGINTVTALVVRPSTEGPGPSVYEAVWCQTIVRVERERTDADYPNLDFNRGGRTREVRALDLTDHPEVQAILDTINHAEPDDDDPDEQEEAAISDASLSTTVPVGQPAQQDSSAPPRPQWAPDPSRRHQFRWWDGVQWTPSVSDNGVTSFDP